MKKMHKMYYLLISCLLIAGIITIDTNMAAACEDGTTLSANKTATGHYERTFDWTIEKSVIPDVLNLSTGKSGTVEYTITITKEDSTDKFYVAGEICVTNGGDLATENLKIVDEIQYKIGSGQFQTLITFQVDLGAYSVLAPGSSHCYPYKIYITPQPNAKYRNVAHVTITNHSGYLPGGGHCTGPDPCPFGPNPKSADFRLPSTPVLINDSITVNDSNGGSWSDINDSQPIVYPKTFTCDEDEGRHDNTATIQETGQSSSASVTVNCTTTAVTLASFNAKPGDRSVTLVWETGDETNNIGFNIYRAESENGDYVRINDPIIFSQADSGIGASYEFVDADVANRQTYFYKLEDIDLNGDATMHGPVNAIPRKLLGIFGK